jgi:holliday junction DNA helicase RuvA
MIASVEGEVIGLGESHLVVNVGGVGLQVYAPMPFRARLRMRDHVFLFTHLIVREDLLALYGFETEAEREYFDLLLSVNGVGPRMAMGVLSVLTVDAIRRAVASEQSEIFARVPGVGKRTAQKILLHLQDRIKAGDMLDLAGGAVGTADESVLEALTTLGYSVIEAQSAIQSIPRETPDDVEERLREALKYFSG